MFANFSIHHLKKSRNVVYDADFALKNDVHQNMMLPQLTVNTLEET